DDRDPAGQPAVGGAGGAVMAVVAVVRCDRGVRRQRAVDHVGAQVATGGGARRYVPDPAVGQVGVVRRRVVPDGVGAGVGGLAVAGHRLGVPAPGRAAGLLLVVDVVRAGQAGPAGA